MSTSLPESHSTQVQGSEVKGQILSLDQILIGLKSYREGTGLPRQLLEHAIARRDEITPHLLEWLRQAVNQEIDPGEDWLQTNFALYLLSQFCEPRAFGLIVDLLSLPDDELELILSDGLTEDGCRFLISTYDDNWDALQGLAIDEGVYEYSRSAAIGAMSGLLLSGHVDRDKVIVVWRDLLLRWTEARRPDLHEFALSTLAVEVARHRMTELRAELEAALDSESFDPMIESPDELRRGLDRPEDDAAFMSDLHHYQPMTDIFADFEKWDFFMTPAERREAEARRNEQMQVLRDQLYRDDPEAARKLFGLRLSDLSGAIPKPKSNPSKKKKRKQQKAARKNNRKK